MLEYGIMERVFGKPAFFFIKTGGGYLSAKKI